MNILFTNLKRVAALLLVMPACFCFTASAHPDDNVFLIDGTETWEFIEPAGTDSAKVKNTITHYYEATRYKENIQPSVIYNNRLRLDKASGKGKARYESASSRNIFHDDNRVCYFDMYLQGPGKKAKVQFERTLTDPAFFARLYLADDYPIRHKEFRIVIPEKYKNISVEELNFTSGEGSPISRRIETTPGGGRTYIYTLTNLEGTMNQESESGNPHPQWYQPVLLIKGWFNNVDNLYKWHSDISRVDTDIPETNKFLSEEVYKGNGSTLSTDERINKIYSWVQSNIRYIAYEEGESGHRPDKPSEVIRKRYGDCKGMALLLATLLQHEGIKAHMAVIGTSNIPFKISDIPSIAATDHAICVAINGNDTLYLDATNMYIPPTHIPGPIQGKDVMLLSHGDNQACRIHNVPVTSPSTAALDSVSYIYTVAQENNALQGTVKRTLKGDFKEMYITNYTEKGQKYALENMAIDLVPLRRSKIPAEELVSDYNMPDGSAVITAPIINTEAVTDAGESIYIDLNASNGIAIDRINTHDRRSPYKLPGRCRIVRHASLSIPEKAKIAYIPENFSLQTPHAYFCCTFSNPQPGTVVMHKVIEITDPLLQISDMEGWNNAVSQWNNACNRQIEISL
ncbi:transglutaminase family protein [uncultured Muribaculum sp.]|uniref:transglutaminase-like domain-containing protein n=1 Tax=uncultured Muribaculum sp. TaxID=1918613 RepID=UPI002674A8E2|nr:transglutaminase domain-containing protein [uncultured Muribaculum sp.]